MLRYPADFPADAARVIVKNWQGGTIVSEKEATAEACWNLVGYGLKASIGESAPGDGRIMMQESPEALLDLSEGSLTDQEMIDKLKTYEDTPHDKRVVGALPIPPKVLAKWAFQLALKVLAGVITA